MANAYLLALGVTALRSFAIESLKAGVTSSVGGAIFTPVLKEQERRDNLAKRLQEKHDREMAQFWAGF